MDLNDKMSLEQQRSVTYFSESLNANRAWDWRSAAGRWYTEMIIYTRRDVGGKSCQKRKQKSRTARLGIKSKSHGFTRIELTRIVMEGPERSRDKAQIQIGNDPSTTDRWKSSELKKKEKKVVAQCRRMWNIRKSMVGIREEPWRRLIIILREWIFFIENS